MSTGFEVSGELAPAYPVPYLPGVSEGFLAGVPFVWVLLQQMANKILG